VGENRNEYRVLVGKPEETRRVGRHSLRWEADIKMILE
jgi:hypothetical protein